MNSAIINIFHVLVVGPLFIYLGIFKKDIPDIIFTILLYLGIVIVIYHTYLAYKKLSIKK
jgi:hypothetical protein